MLVDLFEVAKLLVGILLFIIPGFIWSFFLWKNATFFERIVFGFGLGVLFFIPAIYLLHALGNIEISRTMIILLYVAFLASAIFIYGIRCFKSSIPKINLSCIKHRKFQLLLAVLCFNFLMTFFPHIINNYYLPFHVDEWIDWAFTRTLIETGSTSFINPFTGGEIAQTMEVGFTILTSLIHFLSGCNLLTIFVFMPSILMVLISLTVYNIRISYSFC